LHIGLRLLLIATPTWTNHFWLANQKIGSSSQIQFITIFCGKVLGFVVPLTSLSSRLCKNCCRVKSILLSQPNWHVLTWWRV
jgi:hypothetical protein